MPCSIEHLCSLLQNMLKLSSANSCGTWDKAYLQMPRMRTGSIDGLASIQYNPQACASVLLTSEGATVGLKHPSEVRY